MVALLNFRHLKLKDKFRFKSCLSGIISHGQDLVPTPPPLPLRVLFVLENKNKEFKRKKFGINV